MLDDDGGFTIIENKVLLDERLTRIDKIVYAVLALHADNNKRTAYPSLTRICKLASVTRKPAIQSIRNLEKYGYIRTTKRSGTSTLYHVGTRIATPPREGSQSTEGGGVAPPKLDSYNYTKELKEILDYLNSETDSSYSYKSAVTQRLVKARLKEGFTVEGFKLVISAMVQEWGKDPKMAMYLRPQTLFGTKMENYFEIGAKKIKEGSLNGV